MGGRPFRPENSQSLLRIHRIRSLGSFKKTGSLDGVGGRRDSSDSASPTGPETRSVLSGPIKKKIRLSCELPSGGLEQED